MIPIHVFDNGGFTPPEMAEKTELCRHNICQEYKYRENVVSQISFLPAGNTCINQVVTSSDTLNQLEVWLEAQESLDH